MNDKWFDECSVVAYPHEIRFLNIDGGCINYCVDRHVSEYINKLQNKIKDIEQENRDKDIKNMILQSKIERLNNEISGAYTNLSNNENVNYMHEAFQKDLLNIIKDSDKE